MQAGRLPASIMVDLLRDDNMKTLKKFGKYLYRLYVGIGIVAMAFVAVSVIATVILRYFFNISFIFLEELITVVYTFTTFLGIGMCILEDEHVSIDVLLNIMPEKARYIIRCISYVLITVVNALMVYLSIGWIAKAGNTYTNAMRVQLKYIYGIFPLGFSIGVLCSIIKLYLVITGKEKYVRFKPDPDIEE